MLDLILADAVSGQGARGQVQGSVHCPAGRCLCWTADSGQLSYEVKIDLCEVNLTRVQLTETCKANDAGARDQLLPGIKRHGFEEFCAPSALERAPGPSPCQEMLQTHWRSWISRHPIDRSMGGCKMQALSTAPVLRRGQHLNET